MNHILPILLLISITQLAIAQENKPNPTQSNFEPSLFAVIGVLSLVFFLTFTLIMYAKFCYRGGGLSSIHNIDFFHGREEAMFGPNTRFSGIERSVVESLPFFRFSSLKGSKHGLQCSVCLAEFEEIQILRLLPKCKHGFHVECIDMWLERHSSCPLCRQRVSPEDLATFINLSNSMRLNTGIQPEETEEDEGSTIFELVLERENNNHHHQQQQQQQEEGESEIHTQAEWEKVMINKAWHRLNHQIIISDVMLKNRWSNVSSSDLMFLNSEMLGMASSKRFSIPKYLENDQEMSSDSGSGSGLNSNKMKMGEKRAMSEITALSRAKGMCLDNNDNVNDDYGEVRDRDREDIIKRKLWLPIAKRTVEWFANRQQHFTQETGHTELDV